MNGDCFMGTWLKRYCLERVGGEEGLKKLIDMYQNGAPIRDLMREFKLLSPQCIYVLLDVRRRNYRRRAKITPEIVDKVFELRKIGYSIPRIAEKLDISIGSVHRILKGYKPRLGKQSQQP